MPRSGVNGTYTLPPNTDNQQPLTTISSAMFNTAMTDVQQTFNTPTPIAYGGTNATTEAQARTNLGLQIGVDIPSNAQLSAAAFRRNRVVNNDMRVSQENGTTSGTANGFFPVDHFAQFRSTSAGVLTVQQVASVTPAGSPNRIRATVTTPDASLAAGEYWIPFSQNLEGSNVADFKYGAAGAFNSVLRFGFRAPAGTYAVALHNAAANRSYVSMFTITGGQANTDTVQTVSIPGDVTGTWLTADGVIGLTMDIVVAAGTTYQGAAGWQSGYILATNAISNGMGTGGAVFELFDVGLRLDPAATGVYGQYEVGEVDAVWRSERYWWKTYEDGVSPGTVTDVGAYSLQSTAAGSDSGLAEIVFPIKMANIPTRTAYNPVTGATATWRAGSGSNITVNFASLVSGAVSRKKATASNGGFLAQGEKFYGHATFNARLA